MNPLSRSLRRSFVAVLTALVVTTGCKKDPEVDPDPVTNTLSADAGPDQQGPVGTAIQLDGSASKDSEGKSFTYQWALTRKPAKSTTTIQSPTNAKPTFVPDELGEYEVELTIANASGKSSDRMVVTAGVAQPTAITENIRVKTVLVDRFSNPELPDYVVTRDIAVTSELTLNPGVVIAFERNVRFDINSEGLLIAKGTADKKIRFVGVEKTKGFWAGLMIYSASNANALEHFELLHAGSRGLVNGTKAGMALFGGGKAQIAIKNSLFGTNDGYGLYVTSGSVLREFAVNAFQNNSEAGILLDADQVDKLDAASTFTGGNGRNAVEIMTSALKASNDEVVWAGFADKTPYRLVGGELTLHAGLKLKPGVKIELVRDAIIRVNSTGYLNAQGTATEKIIFTGAQNQAAYWKGIMSYSANNQNLIENAEITNAGSAVVVSGKKAALAVYGANAKTIVKSTKISGSGGYGIYTGSGGAVNADAATANTFEGNALASVQKD
jgi:hypothetical protein